MPQTPLEEWVKTRIGLQIGQNLTRQVLTAYQMQKLRHILDYVKCRSSFYRRRFAAYEPQFKN